MMTDHTGDLKPSSLLRFVGEGARLGMFLSLGLACVRLVLDNSDWLGFVDRDEEFMPIYVQTIIGCALCSMLLSAIVVSIRDKQSAAARLIRRLIQAVFLLAYTGAAAGAVLLIVMRIALEVIY